MPEGRLLLPMPSAPRAIVSEGGTEMDKLSKLSDAKADGAGVVGARHEPARSKKIATTVYITEEQQNLLKELNRRTRVPIAEFIREGIDLVLEKHASVLPGQLGFLNDSSQLNQMR